MVDMGAILIGASKSFIQAKGKIPILSRTRATVLITGETGTGKEMFARAIHYTGERQGKPFVPVNCAAIPEHLAETELFGHSRGAFTSALTEKVGLFLEAHGGTIFLDEINSLPLTVQSKLLRVLQDQQFRPVGSTKSRLVDVKVVAATNTDLRVLVKNRQFREDLFHRLNVLTVTVPSLRDRKEDIELLAEHFLTVYAKDFGRKSISIGQSALAKLIGYAWPGNVRELDGVIQRALAMGCGEVLEAHDLELPELEEPGVNGPMLTPVPRGVISTDSSFQDMKTQVIEEFERTYLGELLTAHQGNISKAARAAKKERRTFQRLLQKYGLDRRGFNAA